MAQHYSDPKRAEQATALPDLEVWHHEHKQYVITPDCVMFHDEESHSGGCGGTGWYYWSCFPGCLPDSEPMGPFKTEAEALADARQGLDVEACETGTTKGMRK